MTAGAEPAVSRTARRYGDLFETTRKDADSLDDCDGKRVGMQMCMGMISLLSDSDLGHH